MKRRRVVERSIGWTMMHHRLARDDETLTANSEAVSHIASIDGPWPRIRANPPHHFQGRNHPMISEDGP